MSPVRAMRLVSSGSTDGRATRRNCKGAGSHLPYTLDGPSLGLGWFPVDALEDALEPFDAFVDADPASVRTIGLWPPSPSAAHGAHMGSQYLLAQLAAYAALLAATHRVLRDR